MGRRSVATNPVQAREVASRQLRTLLQHYDLAEFEAQVHAADMVEMLAGFAKDPLLPVEFRRTCANDVLDRAYGKPATKAQVELVDLTRCTETGTTVGQQLESVKASAELYQELNHLVMRGVPMEQWPEAVQQMAEAMSMNAVLIEDRSS